jgi:hypothetical protein
MPMQPGRRSRSRRAGAGDHAEREQSRWTREGGHVARKLVVALLMGALVLLAAFTWLAIRQPGPPDSNVGDIMRLAPLTDSAGQAPDN